MYLWSKLSSKKWEDAWEERFYGNQNAVIQEIKGGKSIRVEVYCETEDAAEEIKKQFGGSVRKVKNQTWHEPQDLTNKPLLIRDRLVLSQAVVQNDLTALGEKYPERILINIPAEMAFGTGDHPTTATCLRYLVDYAEKRKGDWTMADAGCGTGVIAIAGSLLGASSVQAFDFDEHAVRISEKNLKVNSAENIDVFVEDVFKWKPKHQLDVITANLFSTVLQEAFPIFKAALKDDGEIIISGILAEQWEPTKKAAEEAGLVFPEFKGKKWITALGKHK